MEKKAKVDTYNVSLFVKFLQRLKNDARRRWHRCSTTRLFVYGSGMSDGNGHGGPLPIVVIGGGSGQNSAPASRRPRARRPRTSC